MSEHAVVVGSGPAGVACARALVGRGARVTLLDVGREAPDDARALLAALALDDPADWDPAAAERLRASTRQAMAAQREAGDAGVARVTRTLKPLAGSLYPYAVDEPLQPLDDNAVAFYGSLARGGLTSVWGGAMLPYLDDDLGAWPIGVGDLAEHYRTVLEWVPLVARHDALEELLPLYTDTAEPLARTPQVSAFLRDLDRARDRLAAAGITAGASRLAVWAGVRGGERSCRLAGVCLHGCPYGSIWSAAQELERLVGAGKIAYEPQAFVEHVEETAGGVRVRVRAPGDGSRRTVEASRVFLAAGALSSTRLVLSSLEAYDRTVQLRDSQLVAVPFLRLPGRRVGVERSGNTLAQVFMELRDPAVSSGTVHVQLYGFNDLMLHELAAMSHLPPHVAQRVLGPLLGRIFFAQCYLHSDDSSGIAMTLTRDGDPGRVELRPVPNAATEAVRRRVLARLRGVARVTKAMPLGPLGYLGPPGMGYHVGGSLPMRAAPGPLESDTLGRPHGLERVHVVDASVFPTIPATTVTLSVMANATRIADAA
jgi:choline dehydrogenase-like flavoprotein